MNITSPWSLYYPIDGANPGKYLRRGLKSTAPWLKSVHGLELPKESGQKVTLSVFEITSLLSSFSCSVLALSLLPQHNDWNNTLVLALFPGSLLRQEGKELWASKAESGARKEKEVIKLYCQANHTKSDRKFPQRATLEDIQQSSLPRFKLF